MAINPSNSNAINIKSLPKAQLAVNGDNFILDTLNGTQIIDFQNLNVVKTDVSGNASVNGSLSATDTFFATTKVSRVSAVEYSTVGGKGDTVSNGFYDRFTIQSGLILSAASDTVNNPVYKTITSTVIPSVTASFASSYRRTIDISGTTTFDPGQTLSPYIPISEFFTTYTGIPINTIQANPGAYFIISAEVPSRPNNGYNALYAVADAIVDITGAELASRSIWNSITGLATVIPSMTATAVVPFVPPATVVRTVNDLRFRIQLAFPLEVSTAVYWRFFATF